MPKILIVEDNALNLKLFRDLLLLKNFTVLTLADGRKAFELILEELPDLILMDIQLNGISGIDIIKKVKLNEKTAHIPIVAITAFAMKHEEDKISNSGCDCYLSKPVSVDDFFSTIEKFVQC